MKKGTTLHILLSIFIVIIVKVAALPYLHETLKPLIDTIFSDKKVVELDEQQAKQLKSG